MCCTGTFSSRACEPASSAGDRMKEVFEKDGIVAVNSQQRATQLDSKRTEQDARCCWSDTSHCMREQLGADVHEVMQKAFKEMGMDGVTFSSSGRVSRDLSLRR